MLRPEVKLQNFIKLETNEKITTNKKSFEETTQKSARFQRSNNNKRCYFPYVISELGVTVAAFIHLREIACVVLPVARLFISMSACFGFLSIYGYSACGIISVCGVD